MFNHPSRWYPPYPYYSSPWWNPWWQPCPWWGAPPYGPWGWRPIVTCETASSSVSFTLKPFEETPDLG